MTQDHLRCTALVDAITEYLDGALDAESRARIELHLDECPDCHAALDQFRRTVELAGTLPIEHIDGLDRSTRDRLMAAFRSKNSRHQ